MNKLLERFSPKQKVLLIAGLVIILSIGLMSAFYFTLYQPKVKELKMLQDDLRAKQDKLENMQRIAAELAAQRTIKTKKERELRKLEKGLPPEEYVPTLLVQIENLATKTNSKVSSIAPGAPSVPTEITTTTAEGTGTPVLEYKEMSLNIPFEGTYEGLKEFLRGLATFPMVIVVNSLTISGGGNVDEYGNLVLSAAMPTTVYILPRGKSEK